MVLFALRGVFILLAAAVGVLYVLQYQEAGNVDYPTIVGMLLGGVLIAAGVIGLDAVTKRKKLSAISGIFLGLIAGLLAAYALSFVVDLIRVYVPIEEEHREAFSNLLAGVKVLIGLITCYVSISLVLQTKDDFRFVIPYVEFSKEVRGTRPTVLDTSAIIDGRVLDILDTHIMQGLIIVPRFVLDELQTLADSADKLKRARGRRGLETLQKLQANTVIHISLDDADADGHDVDHKLVNFSHERKARLMTNDFNLNKVASLRGVEVINLNELAKALRPVVLPGEALEVRLIKVGENPTQGVGYLEDGTMIVVENGREHLGQEIELTVTSTIQTSAGRMIFGRFDRLAVPSGFTRVPDDEDPLAPSQQAPAEPPVEVAMAESGTTKPAPQPQTRNNPSSRPRSSSARNPRR